MIYVLIISVAALVAAIVCDDYRAAQRRKWYAAQVSTVLEGA